MALPINVANSSVSSYSSLDTNPQSKKSEEKGINWIKVLDNAGEIILIALKVIAFSMTVLMAFAAPAALTLFIVFTASFTVPLAVGFIVGSCVVSALGITILFSTCQRNKYEI